MLNVDEYKKHLKNNITKDYRKISEDTFMQAEQENAFIAKQLGVEWRLCQTSKDIASITVKDHKPDFPERLSFRLINPIKNPLGRISKQILDRINNDIREKTRLNQWQSTNSAIKWFENIHDKHGLKFFQFAIEKFYPLYIRKIIEKGCQMGQRFFIY